MVIADWVRKTAFAAAENEPDSAIARNVLMFCMFGDDNVFFLLGDSGSVASATISKIIK
jgi:hypothetical protein